MFSVLQYYLSFHEVFVEYVKFITGYRSVHLSYILSILTKISRINLADRMVVFELSVSPILHPI